MDHLVLIPHFGNGRGRLARHGRAVVYAVADPVASASIASWCALVGDRPAADALADLERVLSRAAVSAVAAFVDDGDGLEVLSAGDAPITVDGSPLSDRRAPHRQRLQSPRAVELLAAGTLADDPLLDFVEGVVAADGFSLRRSAAGPTPWSDSAPATGAAATGATAADETLVPPAEPAMAGAGPAMGGAPAMADAGAAMGDVENAVMGGAPAMGATMADELGAAGEPEVSIDPGVMGAPAGLVSLTDAGDDDLPDAAPLPIAGGPGPEPAPAADAAMAAAPATGEAPAMGQAPAMGEAPAMGGAPAMGQPPAATGDAALPGTQPLPVTPAPDSGHVMVNGLRCARGHFNDPRARFCATCGIAMHQASFVLTEDVRPPLGVITFADGTFYSVAGNLVFGRDPDDDPAVRAGTSTPATLSDPANTISRVHAEVRAIEWDVYLVDRGSTNGTFVWNASAQQWERLAPDQPRIIEPGAQISFGRLVAAFDSGLRP